MSVFPGSTPPAGSALTSDTLAAAGHTSLHNNDRDEIRALATKVGTGASTPTSGMLLRGNGVGTSVWGQAALTTDVTGVLPVANGGTGQATLTGLPLASPAISGTVSGGATYSSPTLTTPVIADFTNANHNHSATNKGGQLTATAFANNTITAALLATNAILLGSSALTANATTTNTSATQITELTNTVTIPAGGRSVLIIAFAPLLYTSSATIRANLTIWDGVVGAGTQIGKGTGFQGGGSATSSGMAFAFVTPSAGSKTYNVGLHAESAATATAEAAATYPACLLVFLI